MELISKQEQRREVSAVNKSQKILNYGPDNLYPNRVNYLVENSPRTDECFKVKKRFIYGNGFKDIGLSQLIVNSDGETMDVLLDKLSSDIATFNKGYLHVHYDQDYLVEEVYHLPYECVRKGSPIDEDYKGKIIYYPDWENNLFNKFDESKALWINKFNPEKKSINKQIKQQVELKKDKRELDEFFLYNGQYVPIGIESEMNYSSCVFQSAYEDAVTDGAMKIFRMKSVKNNFNATVLMFFDKFKDDEQRNSTKAAVNSLTGEDNANSIIAFEKQDGQPMPEIKEFKKESLDGYYNVTFEQVRETIRGSWEIHPALLDSTPGKLGADEEEATSIYNEKTKKERVQAQAAFFKIFVNSIWSDRFNKFENFEIEKFNFKSAVVAEEIETEVLTTEEKKENKRVLVNMIKTIKSLMR